MISRRNQLVIQKIISVVRKSINSWQFLIAFALLMVILFNIQLPNRPNPVIYIVLIFYMLFVLLTSVHVIKRLTPKLFLILSIFQITLYIDYKNDFYLSVLSEILLFLTLPVTFIVLTYLLLKGIYRYGNTAAEVIKRTFFTKTRFAFLSLSLTTISLVGTNAYLYQNLQQTQQKVDRVLEVIGGQEALECTEKDLVAKVNPSIVRVVGTYSEGSGVIVKSEGTIITNYHVIAGEPSPKIIFPDYSMEPAEIIMADKAVDLAILKVNRKNLPTIFFNPSITANLSPLKPVYAFGFPSGTSLAGDVTIQKGSFVAVRENEGVEYLHTDLAINPGQSGGALTDACGNLIGINTMGLAGLTLSISSTTALNTWFDLLQSKDPLKDVEKIEFKPDESAVEAVKAFYNYQKVRQLEEAFKLLDAEFLKTTTFAEWQKGYANVLSVDIVSIKADEEDENLVNVKIVSQDLEGEQVILRYFEGTWKVRESTGRNRLYQSNIKQIPEPGWEWYYNP